jgi:hypothetical protein
LLNISIVALLISEIDKSLELSILKPEFDELKKKMEVMKAEAEVVRTKSKSFLLKSENNNYSSSADELDFERQRLHHSSIEREPIIVHLTQFIIGFFCILGDEEYLIRNYHISQEHEKGF